MISGFLGLLSPCVCSVPVFLTCRCPVSSLPDIHRLPSTSHWPPHAVFQPTHLLFARGSCYLCCLQDSQHQKCPACVFLCECRPPLMLVQPSPLSSVPDLRISSFHPSALLQGPTFFYHHFQNFTCLLHFPHMDIHSPVLLPLHFSHFPM